MKMTIYLIAALGCAAPALASPEHEGPRAPQGPPVEWSLHVTLERWQARGGGASLHHVSAGFDADAERLIGWRGGRVAASAQVQGKRSISDRIGDLQTLSNIESGTAALRLYTAWAQQSLGRASLRAGLIDFNSEFDVLDSAGLFINSAHGVGSEIGQTGRNGPSIFPVPGLALRSDVAIGQRVTLRGWVGEGEPGNPDRPARTVIRLRDGEGALLAGEAQIDLSRGKLLIGHWRYSARFDTHDGARARGNGGTYVRGEWRLAGPAEGRRLTGFVRIGTAAPRINAIGRFAAAGLVVDAPFKGRDDDRAGLAIAYAHLSPSWRRLADRERAETAIEATYSARLRPGIELQPDVQWILNPSGERGRRNALVAGVRLRLTVEQLAGGRD